MKYKVKKISWIIFLTLFALFILKPAIETFWSQWMGFVAMHTYDARLRESWKDKSTDFLIAKLGHPSVSYSGAAATILRTRHEPRKITKLERIVKYNLFHRSKTLALTMIFRWDEERAVDLSMEILRSGEKHQLYFDALRQLSSLKYEPAYSYVIDLAGRSGPSARNTVSLLKNYGKSDSIPVLEKMLEQAKSQDDLVAKTYRSSILDAIESIKKQNGILSQEKDSNQ